MAKPKALLLGSIEHEAAKKDWEALAEHADLVQCDAKTPEDFRSKCKNGDYDGVVAMYRTFASVTVTGLFEGDVIKNLPASLKFICHDGAGYDQINIPDCTKRGIFVSNVPTVVNDATADTAVFLTLGMLRNFPITLAALRKPGSGNQQNLWRGQPPAALGHDPEGKTLGILGMGGIGRNYAAKMRAFGMKVIYHNRKPLSHEDADGAEYVEFDDLFKRSDVLSLNLPLNPNTRHIVSTPQFDLMKKEAIIVNTARGAVMDEAALVKALDEGKIAGVGLDVYEEEPYIEEGLWKNEKVLLLPHVGTWTVETQTGMEQHTIANVRKAIVEGKLLTRVPEQDSLPYN